MHAKISNPAWRRSARILTPITDILTQIFAWFLSDFNERSKIWWEKNVILVNTDLRFCFTTKSVPPAVVEEYKFQNNYGW